MTNPSKIVITGDILRLGEAGDVGQQTSNIRWLYNLISYPIFEATNLFPDIIHQNGESGFDARRIYLDLDLPMSLASWAQLFEDIPLGVHKYLLSYFEKYFVVGFELPPSLRKFFDLYKIPYLDIVIHPVRFLDDLIIGFQGSSEEMQKFIGRFAIPERNAYRAAGLIKAYVTQKWYKELPHNNVVFTTQLKHDRSMIINGSFVDFGRVVKKLDAELKGSEQIVLKSHPSERTPEVFKILRDRGFVASESNENIYELLSVPEVSKVATISSSTGIEAKYFQKTTIFLSHVPVQCLWKGDPFLAHGYWGVFQDFLLPDFWRNIFQCHLNVSATDGDKLVYKPNRVRMSLRQFWGFSDIEYDWIRTISMNERRIFSFMKKCSTVSRSILGKRMKL